MSERLPPILIIGGGLAGAFCALKLAPLPVAIIAPAPVGDSGGEDGNVAADAFKKFVSQKTEQLKRELRCEQVEYSVEVENGQVRLKAKGK